MTKQGAATLGCCTAAAVVLALGIAGQARAQERTLDEVQKKVGNRVTQEEREAAAARQKALLQKRTQGARAGAAGAGAAAFTIASEDPYLITTPAAPGGVPHYFTQANWAFSPPLRKFVDRLPGLGPANANNLGQYLSVAKPDTITYPGSDYYEIELREFEEKMHSDLPPTRLRGYVQVNQGTDASGVNRLAPDPIHYLGPTIVAKRDRPVRIKFTNKLPVGAGGNLFLPVDTTMMGAGEGPLRWDAATGEFVSCSPADEACEKYTHNRAVIHLHGGKTPWISDGTPHQWMTPVGEDTPYKAGPSLSNVPDMPDPGEGSMTFFYSNQQSARLMFYHDHAYGITRLNVYAGMAAGYIIQDDEEQALIDGEFIPTIQIPLIVQDKTFVDADTVRVTDPTWNWGSNPPDPTTGVVEPKRGDLWYPHIYSPAQNPYDLGGANAFGRWHYGPWFWPPTTGITYPPVPNPYYDPVNQPLEPPEMPPIPNPSAPGESFMDTAMVNGTPFPSLTVDPRSYRFRILNAANDRFFNLQLYVTDPSYADSTVPGYQSEVRMVPAIPRPACGGTIASDCTCTATAAPAGCFPDYWPTDGREGGVPDPALAGPDFVQIATEGGFLSAPAVVKTQPIAWNLDPTTFNFGNVSDHALLVAPAERADVIVDFSAFAGKTLILYNDAPAAFPASDARLDYYTGAPDLTETGGHSGPQPGFGPNTRTVMQIKVRDVAPAAPFNLENLQAAFRKTATNPGTFARGQDPIIVAQEPYGEAYGTTFPTRWPYWGYSRIQDNRLSFLTFDGEVLTTVNDFYMQPKAIQDEMGEAFDPDYGRMSGKLGLEIPFTVAGNQNFVLQGFVDPATEIVDDGQVQIWKVTHNGVDTHPIHFHIFDVQLLNRVGWDGAIRPPDPNELGWKDTVRISPLEDTIVALRPKAPKVPFGVPDSWRPYAPAEPIGSTMGFTNIDPTTGQPLPNAVVNNVVNFGWEYVWHCHILTHEEDDMMRPIILNVGRAVPEASLLSVSDLGNADYELNWTDPTAVTTDLTTWGDPSNEVGYVIERAEGLNGPFAEVAMALANQTSWVDTSAAPFTYYRYRVTAYNAAGTATSNVAEANRAALMLPVAVVSPTSVAFGGVRLSRTSNAFAVTIWNTGTGPLALQAIAIAGTNAGDFTQTNTCAADVAPHGSCQINVRFAPLALGSRAATLRFQTNDPDHAAVSVALTGTGLSPPPATSVSLTGLPASPVTLGTLVTFTAQGAGSTGYDYRFWVQNPLGAWTMVQDYGNGPVFTYAAPGAGTYNVSVHVRTTATVALDASATLSYRWMSLTPTRATAVTLTADPTKPSPIVLGTTVRFTAVGSGSTTAGLPSPASTYQYRFWVFGPSGTWTIAQDYGSPAGGAFDFTPATLGSYVVAVHVRTTTTVAYDVASPNVPYQVISLTPTRATSVTLTGNPTNAAPVNVGSTVTFTAVGSGSITAGAPTPAGTYQYRFWVQAPATGWQIAQDYGSPAGGSFAWTPATAGTHAIAVHVRTTPLVALDVSSPVLNYTAQVVVGGN